MDQQAQNPFGSTAAAATPTPGAGTEPAAAPRGNIAENIFAEVEQMTAGGTMNRSEAFEEISMRTGRRAGTVAANFEFALMISIFTLRDSPLLVVWKCSRRKGVTLFPVMFAFVAAESPASKIWS